MSQPLGISDKQPRIPEIDWLKGLAILFVLLIHAKVLSGTIVHEYLINRAVPLLIVLFGLSSSLWWTKRQADRPLGRLTEWYRGRFLRLMIPFWATLTVWYVLATSFKEFAPRITPRLFIASLLGYAPLVDTSWFVTLILQLVCLFPFLQWLVGRLGIRIVLALGLVITCLCHLSTLHLIDVMRGALLNSGRHGFYYFAIFSPAYTLHLAAGIAIARVRRLGVWVVGISAGMVFAGFLLHRFVLDDPFLRSGLLRLVDVPLTVTMLGVVRVVLFSDLLARGLLWCGKSSWGIYMGQLLVHNAVRFLGVTPETGPLPERMLYFMALLIGAICFVGVGNVLREEVRKLAEHGS